ncbi:protein kinase [Phycicoccus sp. CSK15P-2]|uniref:serine/threonine-protein kinase n=1 Tax=Phycicoccus sp. CSK15P-2 TaxID=2807627 RepID=UPI001952552A|nr:serine/threonine-protein kinase [Phycicoccus sp. CSK15P-2]MBM6403888.1 protein kinase [Phycicoccus sp. CSK15P-2]
MTTDDRRLAGRYHLDSPIGQGGMGEVWRATDTVLGREVAVKTIDLRRVPDESGAARFEREAKVTAAMSHPNVVTVHDTGVEGDTAYLVMELLPGPSLADRLADGPLPVEEVVEVGRQVASALSAAHERGLVHRDIKPANLVYAADGRLRVLDFGITQLGDAGGDQALTATHTVMGTAEYLAPEQATGARVDGRADLYALGCVLYALLSGRAPFTGPTSVATMMMHTNDAVPDIRELRPDTPVWLAALVGNLLAKSPEDRPAGAGAVLEALDSRSAPPGAAATTVLPAAGAATTRRMEATPPPPPPGPPPATYEPERQGGGGSPALWVLAVVAVLALGLLAWWLLGGDRTSTEGTPSASPTVSSPSPEPTTSVPEETSAEPTPTSEPTETAPDPAPVEGASAALGDEVGALRQDGTIDNDTAKIVDDPLKDVDKALRDEDADDLTDARDTLVEDYRDAVDDGTMPPEAADRLDPLVEDLSSAVDDYTQG